MTIPLNSRISTHHWALSRSHATKDLKAPGTYGGFYSWMLCDDFDHLHYAYKIDLNYEGADHGRGNSVICSLLGELGQYGRENGAELFAQLVTRVARDHLMHGRCLFEIFGDVDDGATTSTPRLGILPGWSLRHQQKRTFQATPKTDGVEWRHLPSASLVEFRLPGRLSKELYRTRARLQAIDERRPGDPDMIAMAKFTGYSFDIHRNSLDEIAARVTRSIGWDGRNAFLGRATDSYRTYRQLRFRRTWLIIVSATAETLSTICSHPSVNDGTPIKVRVTGLPDINAIENCIAAVMNGTKSLDEIFNTVLHPRNL
jgi:hypothetical protein